MNKKILTPILIVIIVIVIGAIIALVVNFPGKNNNGTATGDTGTTTNDTSPSITITAKHSFDAGTHIVAGEVELPTPCYILNQEVVVAESFPEQVTINFTSSTQADTCIQVITPTRFRVEFDASQYANIKATWNGRPAILNLIPSTSGELENFEIYFKG